MPLSARWMRIAPAHDDDCRAIYAALAQVQPAVAAPIVTWRQGRERNDFAFIVPRRHAPVRPARRAAWALSPALATCRYFGLSAYLCGDDLRLHGQRLAGSTIEWIGECMVAASSLAIPFPVERHVEDLFRARIEAQHDWQFETSWPTPAEANNVADLRGELAW